MDCDDVVITSGPHLRLVSILSIVDKSCDFATPFCETVQLVQIMAEHGQSSSTWQDAEANKLPEKVEKMKLNGELPKGNSNRKRVVVVGLGMVGIAFM